MEIVRFIFLTVLKTLGLIFVGLLAAKAVSNLAGGQEGKRLKWLQRGLYLLILGLAAVNAYNLGNDVAAANYAWASQTNLAQAQPGKAYANALRAVELRPGVNRLELDTPEPAIRVSEQRLMLRAIAVEQMQLRAPAQPPVELGDEPAGAVTGGAAVPPGDAGSS